MRTNIDNKCYDWLDTMSVDVKMIEDQKLLWFSLMFRQIAHPNIFSSPFPAWLPPTGHAPGPAHLGSWSFVYLLT